ncbi:MAG: adenylate/guanylate cyclase domain-containing protein [Gemmatimonadetes bacterium]|nr:adenylate/guanylate cyclase domain-containing protein [Gemmatimonadota bacterium]
MTLRDRILLGIFIALWVATNGLQVAGWGAPIPRAVYVEREAGGAFPVVRGYATEHHREETVFRPGDRVVRVGRWDLEGKGQPTFLVALSDEAWARAGAIAVEVERDGERMVLSESIPGRPPRGHLPNLINSIVLGIAAILLMVRARPSVSSRLMFSALAVEALLYSSFMQGPAPVAVAMLVFAFPIACLIQPLFVLTFLSFPEEAGSLRGVHRYWPWIFALSGLPIFAGVNGFPLPLEPMRTLTTLVVLLFVSTNVSVVAMNFRRSGPVGRRKIKWIAYAVYVSALIAVVAYAFGDAGSADAPLWTHVATSIALAMFPAAVLIAALRFDLFDVDRLLGATVSYNLLAIVVVGGGFFLVPSLTGTLTVQLGVDPTLGRSSITVALAAIVIFTERRLRPQVERVFFRERFALEQAMKDLPEKFASVRRAAELWALTGGELVENLRPTSCVIFVEADRVYVPVFTGGDALPPQIPAGTSLVGWVAASPEARLVPRTGIRQADPLSTAILADLGTQVVFPIQRAGALEAFVCIGEKRSGDIFTKTDLTLLTAVAKTLSSHMLRFDEAELLERARATQERMRRYVPGAVAEAIALGDDLETGEREVSVLFVDLRGYTAFADGREATDIFSTVNRYTETVSAIVNDEGGVVVEFNGDGMMAVFGAPRPLAHKETAALRAARRLVTEVAAMGSSAEGGVPMSVGVGVATGLAFVGNIEAVDRTIWSAIGSTTNLAARLQTLTRERSASVLVDSTTWERGRDVAPDFVRHPDVAIRGRKAVETLYALPLAAT